MAAASSSPRAAAPVTALEKSGSALFYGVASIAVIFLNKIILSEYEFGDFIFLSLSQFLSTVLVLLVLNAMRRVEVPAPSFTIFREIAPVAVMFMGNVVSGLGSTKTLSIPMFTVLRRFSIMMTMVWP
jgi:solute carrier family 35 protein